MDEFGGVCAVFGAHDAREEKDALHNGETHECAGAEHQEQGGNSGVFAAVAGVVKGEADGEKRERQDFRASNLRNGSIVSPLQLLSIPYLPCRSQVPPPLVPVGF